MCLLSPDSNASLRALQIRSAETILCCYSGSGEPGGGQSQYSGHSHGGDNPTILSVLSSGGYGGPDDHDSTTHGPTTTDHCTATATTPTAATYDPATAGTPADPRAEERGVPPAPDPPPAGDDDVRGPDFRRAVSRRPSQ